jgi:hypothetical protein
MIVFKSDSIYFISVIDKLGKIERVTEKHVLILFRFHRLLENVGI